MFQNKKVIVATMHGKETVINPILQRSFNMHLFVAPNLNTDALGTFTREKKRSLGQLETCIRKAEMALATTVADFSIASEGSFMSHPHVPMVPFNIEMVVLMDKNQQVFIGESGSLKTQVFQQYVASVEEALALADQHDFPNHGIIVRKHPSHVRSICKDLVTKEHLAAAVAALLAKPFCKRVFLESDLRAHRNPTRMRNIELATMNLVENLNRNCPQCLNPGFRLTGKQPGLPCAWCNHPTQSAAGEIYSCYLCQHQAVWPGSDGKQSADPGACVQCNP